jgi:hypothetical protein
MVAMPAAVREWLAARIERSWPEPGPVVAAIPAELPPGRIERLEPAPRIAFATPAGATPEERAAAEEAYFAHNRAAYDHLRQRGFFSP